MTDQAAYRRYTAEAETALTRAGQNMSAQDRLSWTRLGNAWATLALAAAQERVQPADRPTDDDRSPTFIVVNNELIKPTEAAVERNVVLTDDRGRRWAAAAGPDELYWEAVLV